MRDQPAVWPTLDQHLKRMRPDRPVLYFCPQALQATAHRFQRGFGGLVTYAVKANDHPEVLENLVGAGLLAFDVASPAEMARVRSVLPNAVLHYHNPVRSEAEIAEAVAQGVKSWSVDSEAELSKLAEVPRGEISVRLALPVAGAAYDFGDKFGAGPERAVKLLRQVVEMGFAPSITFHPGTQCADPQAWGAYIGVSAEVAGKAGLRLNRLNVGGGFAAQRCKARPDLEAIFTHISGETRRAFGADAPELVCEPGRAMVADAFSLALRVKAVREDGAVFLNDGIYGALAEWRDIGAPGHLQVWRENGKVSAKTQPRVVFGPTCDSLDRLPEPLALPQDIQEGDYVIAPGMGAYAAAISTRFNGYGQQDVVTVARL